MRVEQVVLPIMRAAANHDWASRAAGRVLRPWNPLAPSRYGNPYPLYEDLRDAIGPIGYQRSLQAWNVVGYDACEEVLRAPNMSVDRTDLLGVVRPYSQLDPTTIDLFSSTMLMKDPPDHTRLRSLVSRVFTPRQMASLEPNVEKIASALLHDMSSGQTVDAMETFCGRLPIYVISDMLGLPQSQWQALQEISDGLVKYIDPINAFKVNEMEQVVASFRSIIGDLIVERTARPQDDLISKLIATQEEDGDRLGRLELESMVAILMVAGHETTASLLGTSLLALQQHRSAQEQLRAEPEIASNAVEELLRFDPPVHITDRVATADIEISGQHIEKGQLIGIFLAAANRDPERYDRPAELILDRQNPRPLSFSHGIHHCLGAALARLEMRIALPLFLEAFPDYHIDVSRLEWKRSLTVRGPDVLPMKL